jgi:hypothetical protein
MLLNLDRWKLSNHYYTNQGNKSTLNRAYNKHIYNILTTLSEENEERWRTILP